MHRLLLINDFLFLLSIPKQDQEISSCSRSGLSLPGRGHVLVRCSHTITGLRTLFLFLQLTKLVWNSLVPFALYSLLPLASLLPTGKSPAPWPLVFCPISDHFMLSTSPSFLTIYLSNFPAFLLCHRLPLPHLLLTI